MLTKLITNKILPANIANMLIDLEKLTGEAKELSDRLQNPLTGPLIPYCIKSLRRINFCTEITRNVILVSAGGAGIPAMAESILANPDEAFAIFTEVFIPVVNDMAKEGKTLCKTNLDKTFMILLNVNLLDISKMDSSQFATLVFDKLK